MINFHKVGNYYSTLVMLGIGCGYMYSPSTLLEAFNFTIFLWAALPMGKQWMLINLFPVGVNVLISLLLLIVPESESVSDSVETGLRKNKKD
jgi:hypothetical protein